MDSNVKKFAFNLLWQDFLCKSDRMNRKQMEKPHLQETITVKQQQEIVMSVLDLGAACLFLCVPVL